MNTDQKPASRIALVQTLNQIICDATTDPAEELVVIGEALAKIGRALKGQSVTDMRAIIKAVTVMYGADE